MYENELRQICARFYILLVDFVHELRGSILVGNIHVEPRIFPRGMAVERLRHGYVREETGAGGLQVLVFIYARELESLPEVQETHAVAHEVAPDGAAFQLIFGMHRRIRPRKFQPPGCGARSKVLLLLTRS